MPTNLASYAPTPTGRLGLLPNKDGSYDTTVVSPGSVSGMFGLVVAVVHVICWILAITFSWVSNGTMDSVKITNSTGGHEPVADGVKAMTMLQGVLTILSFLGAAVHAAFARMPAPLSSAFLLFVVLLTAMIAGANMSSSAVTGDTDAYNMAVLAGLFVALSSSMVFAFYVEMAVRGKIGE